MLQLEKSQTIDDIEVENVKEKVRSLALQTKPSVPLILVTLDELARTARRKGHSEAYMYEELSRQVNLHQEKIDIQSFSLSVWVEMRLILWEKRYLKPSKSI